MTVSGRHCHPQYKIRDSRLVKFVPDHFKESMNALISLIEQMEESWLGPSPAAFHDFRRQGPFWVEVRRLMPLWCQVDVFVPKLNEQKFMAGAVAFEHAWNNDFMPKVEAGQISKSSQFQWFERFRYMMSSNQEAYLKEVQGKLLTDLGVATTNEGANALLTLLPDLKDENEKKKQRKAGSGTSSLQLHYVIVHTHTRNT